MQIPEPDDKEFVALVRRELEAATERAKEVSPRLTVSGGEESEGQPDSCGD